MRHWSKKATEFVNIVLGLICVSLPAWKSGKQKDRITWKWGQRLHVFIRKSFCEQLVIGLVVRHRNWASPKSVGTILMLLEICTKHSQRGIIVYSCPIQTSGSKGNPRELLVLWMLVIAKNRVILIWANASKREAILMDQTRPRLT